MFYFAYFPYSPEWHKDDGGGDDDEEKNQITFEHMKIVNEYLCTQFIECQNDLRVADCNKCVYPQDKGTEKNIRQCRETLTIFDD